MVQAREIRSSGEALFNVAQDKTALLIVDMQNAFLEPGALLEVSDGRSMIPKLTSLIEQCRAQKLPIVWIQLDSTAPYGGMLIRKYPMLESEKILFKGTHSFDLFNEVPVPLENEYRIVKHKYDAFHQTDLDTLLRNLSIESIIITGVTTDCCCESTARAAFERDYCVAFTSDGTATFDPRQHAASLKLMDELFGRVMTIDEVMNELAG